MIVLENIFLSSISNLMFIQLQILFQRKKEGSNFQCKKCFEKMFFMLSWRSVEIIIQARLQKNVEPQMPKALIMSDFRVGRGVQHDPPKIGRFSVSGSNITWKKWTSFIHAALNGIWIAFIVENHALKVTVTVIV